MINLYGFNAKVQATQPEEVDVVVIWWQSNARGQNQDVGWVTFPDEYKVLIPDAFINYAYDTPPNNNLFQPLDGAFDSVNKRFRYLGMQYGLAKKYTEYKSKPLYIVHYAIGSTSLQGDWNPDGPGALYANLVTYVRNAINTILGQNKIPRIVSYIGIGGEQDGQVGIVAGQMKTMLNGFINRIRGEQTLLPYHFGGANVNFQIGLLGTWTTTQNVAYPERRLLIRADQQAVANEGVNIQVFETEDLPSIIGDEIHRTTPAQFVMADRVFNNIKNIT